MSYKICTSSLSRHVFFHRPLTDTITVDSYNMLMIAISAISLPRRGVRKLPQGVVVLLQNKWKTRSVTTMVLRSMTSVARELFQKEQRIARYLDLLEKPKRLRISWMAKVPASLNSVLFWERHPWEEKRLHAFRTFPYSFSCYTEADPGEGFWGLQPPLWEFFFVILPDSS